MIKSTHFLFSRSHGLRGNAYLNAPAFPRWSVGTRVPTHSHSLGFTLIELLITLGIVAIIMSVAVPSFQRLIANNRLTTQANSMVGALTVARSEAAKQNKVVTVRKNGGGWASGWSVFVDNNQDGLFNGTDVDIRQYPAITGNIIKTTSNFISYEPSGRSNVNASIYFCSPSSLQAFRRVVIFNSGRVRTETENSSSMTYAGQC